MASCVRNIFTKNYQNPLTDFQVKIENVRDVFGTQCMLNIHLLNFLKITRYFGLCQIWLVMPLLIMRLFY